MTGEGTRIKNMCVKKKEKSTEKNQRVQNCIAANYMIWASV